MFINQSSNNCQNEKKGATDDSQRYGISIHFDNTLMHRI